MSTTTAARRDAARIRAARATAAMVGTGTAWYATSLPGSAFVVNDHKHAARRPPSPTT